MSSWSPLTGQTFETLPSTNDWLKNNHQGVGDWVRAEVQSGGRGRGDHQWHSPVGNMYLSVAVPRREPLTLISLAVGVTLVELCQHYGNEVSVKWPNDILLQGKKCGGILSEVLKDVVIVGVGLNLTNEDVFTGAASLQLPAGVTLFEGPEAILELIAAADFQVCVTVRPPGYRSEVMRPSAS